MSIRCFLNNTLIKENSSFYLLANGDAHKADVIRILEPTTDDEGNKKYIFYVEATIDGRNYETYVLSSGDPYINQKVFPTLSAIHDYLTLPFENGEKAYFVDAKCGGSIEDALKKSTIKEVSVIVTPARRNRRHISPIMQYNDCLFRVKDKNGDISEEYVYNIPLKNLFKTREEAEKELKIFKISTIAFYIAELAADYITKKEIPYAVDFTFFGEKVHDIVSPVFKEFLSSDTYRNDCASVASMAEKLYGVLNKQLEVI